MSNNITKILDGLIAVSVDKDWSDFVLNESASNVLMFCTKKDIRYIQLPPGSYEFLFLSKNCSEEDAGKVCSFIPTAYYSLHKGNGISGVTTSALESFHSLLRSKNLNPDNNYAILKCK